MILDLLFPNRCIHCNRIIDHKLLVCGLCFSHICFTHYNYSEKNPVWEKCNLYFPVANAFALIHFEKQSLSRKIIHELKYRNQKIIGKVLAEWTTDRLDFTNKKPDPTGKYTAPSKETERKRI